jgi:drug/metabolite transporter (DMT)-like permease
MRGPTAGAAFATTTAVIWGGMFVIGKSALDRIDAFHLTTVRYGVASAVLLVLLGVVEGRGALGLEGRGVRLWLLGSLGFAGFNLLAFTGLHHARPESASLIVAFAPIVTALVLWARTGVRPRRFVLITFPAALFGVALVISRGDLTSIGGSVGWGDALVLAGVVSFVVYTISAGEFPGFSPLRYTALTASLGWTTILGATVIATVSGLEPLPSAGSVWSVTPQLAYITFLGAVVAVLLWNASVGSIGAQNTALSGNLLPVTTFAIEIARGYRPGGLELAGAAITIGALVASNLLARRAPERVAEPEARDGELSLRRRRLAQI